MTTEAELGAWLTKLEQTQLPAHDTGRTKLGTGAPVWEVDEGPALTWITDSRFAFAEIFPKAHSISRSVEEVVAAHSSFLPQKTVVEQLKAILRSAITLIKDGRLRSFHESIRAETVVEVLDQADALKAANALVAATVLAGGALETHLRHLCQRNGLTVAGEGNIASYDQAIAQHRNDTGKGIYSAIDSGHVGVWGKTRNEAAHKPTEFKQGHPEVARMLAGVREFISRNQ